jgi:twitching motility protein PilJ
MLGTLVVILLVMAGASGYYAMQAGKLRDQVDRQAMELRDAAYEVAAATSAATAGQPDGFARLARAMTAARSANSALAPASRPAAFADLAGAVEEIESSSQYVHAAAQAAADADEASTALERHLAAVAEGVPAASRAAAAEAVTLAQRASLQVATIAAGIGEPDLTSRLAGDDELRLGQIVLGLAGEDATLGLRRISGDAYAGEVEGMVAGYRRISDAVVAAVAASEKVSAVRSIASTVAIHAGTVGAQLDSSSVSTPGGLSIGPLKMTDPRIGLAALALAMILALVVAGLSFAADRTRKAAEEQARQNERNQAAILRLLDELGSLADGDLTVQATVTEDITGAIADSINYAIEALRDLVTTINNTAIRIDAAARQTQATSAHIAQASETQSKQVGDATESIARMAASVEAVSGDAERSADVSRHSVDIAHKGGEAVRRTIEGMNAIRETIQETSKRIKRLGESSQEIGNIVELINDIAEQTNILALNASIQASMAGEAGRGFAVVADEVQRLAERSANATRQIEVLVKTIQSDTNEAVVSMERSTTDVVGGALLAENAGAALDEIESVSNQIANLVQNISSTSREQAMASTDITRNMGVLREVSSQTAEATGATSESIGKLADLAAQLRNSVAGFRLPDSNGSKGSDAGPVFPESFSDSPRASSAGGS